MQQKRHTLELEQRSLLDRQRDWQLKEAAFPTLQRQAADLHQQLTEIEHHAKRLEQIRTDGVAIRVQLETSLPQARETLQKEIHEEEEKRAYWLCQTCHCAKNPDRPGARRVIRSWCRK
jgi:predicted  nucleic acid-binding Zn-ribbon protein